MPMDQHASPCTSRSMFVSGSSAGKTKLRAGNYSLLIPALRNGLVPGALTDLEISQAFLAAVASIQRSN